MQRKIKICHITTLHPSQDTRIFHKQCVSLAKAGYEVKLLVANQKSELINGIEIISIDLPKSRGTRMRQGSKLVFEKAKELDADIYHFHDPELLPVGVTLKKLGKISIYDAHEDVPVQMLSKLWIPKLLRPIASRLFRIYENNKAAKLSAVVVANPSTVKRFSKVNKHTIDVCNFPILEEFGDIPTWESRENNICYVGRIDEARGIDHTMQMLEATYVKSFHLAGWFGSESLEQEMRKTKGWEKTIYHGMLDRKEIQSVFAKCKMGLVTLKPLPNYKLALAVKMFEYMGAGIPVIASDFDHWREIIQQHKCGLLVDPEKPKSISDAINFLLSMDDEAKAMGKRGAAAVKEFYNWKTQEKKLLHLYDQLLAKN